MLLTGTITGVPTTNILLDLIVVAVDLAADTKQISECAASFDRILLLLLFFAQCGRRLSLGHVHLRWTVLLHKIILLNKAGHSHAGA